MPKKITTYDQRKGKSVLARYVDGDVFYRKVKPQHWIRFIGGWGTQKNVVESLVKNDIKWYEIKEPDKSYRISLECFLKKSFLRDLGHGEQYLISKNAMLKEMNKEKQPELLFENSS